MSEIVYYIRGFLFLSPNPVLDSPPTKNVLYQRCHEMGDIVVDGLW